jgi:hypothetical protein
LSVPQGASTTHDRGGRSKDQPEGRQFPLQSQNGMPGYILKCERCGSYEPFLVHQDELPGSNEEKAFPALLSYLSRDFKSGFCVSVDVI